MLTFGLALAFSIGMGIKGESLWWSVLATLCVEVFGVLTSIFYYTTNGRSLSDVLMSGYWGRNLAQFVVFAVIFCSVQALTRRIVSKRTARETSI
jgi:hypothetical protein